MLIKGRKGELRYSDGARQRVCAVSDVAHAGRALDRRLEIAGLGVARDGGESIRISAAARQHCAEAREYGDGRQPNAIPYVSNRRSAE